MSIPPPGDEERIGGVVKEGLPFEPNRLLFVGNRDLLGVGW
jgi:hypothetical protein